MEKITTYMLIDAGYLLEGEQAPTDIYEVDESGKDVNFLFQRYHVFNAIDMKRIAKARPLYVHKESKKAFDDYCIEHLEALSKKNHFTFEVKSTLIFKKAESIIESMFQDPHALGNVKKTQNLVDNMVEMIMDEDFTIQSLMKIAAHDYYTHTHSINVSIYALSLGRFMKLDPKTLKLLGEAAILHDVGKSKISKNIINKNGPLTAEEFAVMRKHPVYGYDIAVRLGVKEQHILDGIRHHHEKLNGTGYPDKLKGERITLFARIIGVCDIFDALTTKRSYKDPVSTFNTLKMMKEQMHAEIDMHILEQFILMMGDKHPSM